jgi:hypothetical protein
MEIRGLLNVAWHVVCKDGSETFTQTAEDKDEALLVACDLFLQGKRILCVGPFGREAQKHIHNTKLEGAALRALLYKMVQQ